MSRLIITILALLTGFKLISSLKESPWKIETPHENFPVGEDVLKVRGGLVQSSQSELTDLSTKF
jgi:hypothetical protein